MNKLTATPRLTLSKKTITRFTKAAQSAGVPSFSSVVPTSSMF
jgi:hypothetical protein